MAAAATIVPLPAATVPLAQIEDFCRSFADGPVEHELKLAITGGWVAVARLTDRAERCGFMVAAVQFEAADNFSTLILKLASGRGSDIASLWHAIEGPAQIGLLDWQTRVAFSKQDN